MSALPKLHNQHLSHKEYLSLEQEQDQRYEYFAGEVFTMAGGTFKHALISSNGLFTLINSLHDQYFGHFYTDITP